MVTMTRDPAAREAGTAPRAITAAREPSRTVTPYVWAALRLLMGWTFLWAFIDKLFGLGFATSAENAWVNGGSPTFGFLSFATHGPLAGVYQTLAGSTVVDAVFMAGLAGVGLSLPLGVGMRIGTLPGALMLLFIYTAGIIDVEMAVARTLTACSIGLVAGFGTLRLQRRMPELFQVDLARPSEMPYPAVAVGSAQPWSMEITQFARRFWTDLSFIGKYFTLGLLIAALVKSLLSEEWIVHILGDASHWSVPAAVALGVPLYACGGGSIPVIDSMMQMGMTRGAALAFFISGPATKFPTLAVFGTVFGSRLLGLYLAVMLVGALIWGWVYPFSGGPLLPNWN